MLQPAVQGPPRFSLGRRNYQKRGALMWAGVWIRLVRRVRTCHGQIKKIIFTATQAGEGRFGASAWGAWPMDGSWQGSALLTGVCTHAPSRRVHSPLPPRLCHLFVQGACGPGVYPSHSHPLESPALDTSQQVNLDSCGEVPPPPSRAPAVSLRDPGTQALPPLSWQHPMGFWVLSQ